MSSKVVHAREAKLRGTEYALLAARPEAGRQAPVRWLLAPAVAPVLAQWAVQRMVQRHTLPSIGQRAGCIQRRQFP